MLDMSALISSGERIGSIAGSSSRIKMFGEEDGSSLQYYSAEKELSVNHGLESILDPEIFQ
jgi:hypothetical protein